MGAISNVNGVSAQWEDSGYVFNPYPIYIQTTERCTIRLRVDQSYSPNRYNIPIDREPVRKTSNSTIYETVFDVSGVSRLLFPRELFGVVQYKDEIFRSNAQINIYKIMPGTTTEIYIGGMNNIIDWGGLQIGELYKRRDTFMYWEGLPFTVPLTYDRYPDGGQVPLYWYERIDEGTYSNRGAMGIGKYNLPVGGYGAKRRIVWKFTHTPIDQWEGIFTREFDHTFRGIGSDSFFINIRVAPCVRDGLYLRWVSPLGEWLYFNFDITNRSKVSSNNTISIEPEFYNVNPRSMQYGIHPGTTNPIGKNGQVTYAVVANLIDSDIFDYVNTLETSPLVYMYLGIDEAGADSWARVDIAPGTFVRSGANLQDLTFNVLMPREFLQSL